MYTQTYNMIHTYKKSYTHRHIHKHTHTYMSKDIHRYVHVQIIIHIYNTKMYFSKFQEKLIREEGNSDLSKGIMSLNMLVR